MGGINGMGFYPVIIVILVTFGAVPLICGIAALIIRAVKKRRTKELYLPALVISIIFIAMGTTTVCIPLAVGVIDWVRTNQTINRGKTSLDFYNAYEETDATADATEDSVSESGFDYNGMHYSCVNGMQVKLHDPYRKEAAANLAYEKKTIFRYDNQSGCDLLCLEYYVYCPDEQMDTLEQYYRSGEFSYLLHCNLVRGSTKSVIIPDTFFFSLYDLDSSVVKECKKDVSKKILSSYPENTDCTITQICGDKDFERSFCVEIGEDDSVYICYISKISGCYTSSDALYQVTDPSVSQLLLELYN